VERWARQIATELETPATDGRGRAPVKES